MLSRVTWAVAVLVGCSGTVSPDGGIDSGVTDSGPADAGPTDAGSASAYSCTGIAHCIESSTVTGAAVIVLSQQCEEMGTAAAQTVFNPLFECIDGAGCGSASNSTNCVTAATAPPSPDGGTDGGVCWPEWKPCLAQGSSCGAIVTCLQPFPSPTAAQVTGCESIGTGTATGLAQTLVSCWQASCSPGAAVSCTENASADGGACSAQFTDCMNDSSGSGP